MSAVLLAVLAVISGTLHAWHDNRPIANARIALRSGSTTISTTTGRDGRFTLMGVPAGAATLTLDAPGFAPASVRMCVYQDEVRTLALKMRTGGSAPQLNAVSNYNSAVANGLHQNTSDVYFLG